MSSVTRRRGFTLIELLVVIAIIAILAAILFPVFAKAREKARSISCLSNLKQQGLAALQYVQDYDETFPAYSGWKGKFDPYMKSQNLWICPSRKNLPWYYGQGFNLGLATPVVVAGYSQQSLAAIQSISHKILWPEWDRCNAGPPVGPTGLFDGGATCYWAATRVHTDGSNVMFGDGHAKWMKPEQYHSTMDHEDGSGHPLPAGAVAVSERTWRKYWDTAYDVNE